MTFQGSRAGNMLYNYRRLSYEDKRRKTAFHSRVPLSDGRFAESGVKAQGFKDVAEAAIETDLKYEGIATCFDVYGHSLLPPNRNRPEIRRDCDNTCPFRRLRPSTLNRNRPEIRRDCDISFASYK